MNTTTAQTIDGSQAIPAHDPALYKAAVTADKVDGWDSLTEEHFDFYRQEGYLAIENAFTDTEVQEAKAALLDLILGRVPGFEGIAFENGAPPAPEWTEEQRQDAVRKLKEFVPVEPRLKHLSEHPRMTPVLTQLLGEPPQLFQDMALIKPPRIGREKPWHQDKAYFNFPIETPVVGVWIALDEATVANGCMHVQPQGHQQGPIVHFKRRDWQICDTEIMGKPCVAVPLKPGGVLLFDGLLPHGTPTNHSVERRKAVQYHYAPASAVKGSLEARLAVFGSEGKDVEC